MLLYYETIYSFEVLNLYFFSLSLWVADIVLIELYYNNIEKPVVTQPNVLGPYCNS